MNNKISKGTYLIGIVIAILLVSTVVAYENTINSREASDVNKVSYSRNVPFGGHAMWTDSNYDINELTARASLIVIGKVIKSTPKMSDVIVLTYHDIKVEKCFKGNKKANDIIQIVQTGGILNGKVTPQVDEDPLLNENTTCYLFLRDTKDGYAVLGGFEGILRIENGNSTQSLTAANSKTTIIVPEDKIGQIFKDKN